MTRVLYDHQVFVRQPRGGISRYFTEIIRALNLEWPEVVVEVSSPTIHNQHLAALMARGSHRILHQSNSGWAQIYRRISRPFPRVQRAVFLVRSALRFSDTYTRQSGRARLKIREGGYDVFHPTLYDPYFLGDLDNRPFVVTVFDMIHELYSDTFAALRSDGLMTGKRELVDRATRVIAISETTKRDLVELYGLAPERVQVIHLGASLNCEARELDSEMRAALPDRFVLFVGRRQHYKNFSFFTGAAIETFREHGTALLCVGGGPPVEDEIAYLRHLHGENVVRFMPEVSDDVLAGLLRASVAYVSPSLYEGFGLPTLEAFSLGCPAVLSRIDAHVEVAGSAARYFDPNCAQSVRTCLRQVLESASLREDLAAAGRQRLRKFSWSRAAAQTVEVYEAALRGRR